MRLRVVLSRIAGLFAGQRADAEVADELRAHLELEIEENIRRGMDPSEARRAALIASGGLTMASEAVREQRRLPWIDAIAADARYAFRTLRCSPAYSVVAITTLALGIGANTAIFSMIDGVLLRPLPYPEPERLVSVTSVVRGATGPVSPADFMGWRRSTTSFAGLAASATSETILTGSGEAQRLTQARVSANAFDVLRVRPVLGRAFLPGEDEVAAPRVAVLSEALWRARFGADTSIIGKTLDLDGFPTTVVGVAPSTMRWPAAVDVWLTTRFSEHDVAPTARDERSVTVIGRLAPNASVTSAQAEIDATMQRTARSGPTRESGVGVRVAPLLATMVGNVRKPLFVLLGAVAFVLLIACANVGSLTLGRVAARDAELAVRRALGASRGRIVRQVLVESLVLSALGGASGLALALVGTPMIVSTFASTLPRPESIRVDTTVLVFAFLTTLVTGILFGVIPALHGASSDVSDRLRGAGRGSIVRKSEARTRGVLVIGEIALAIVLLSGAGLLLRTIARLRDVDLGFQPDRVSTFSLGQLPRKYATKQQEIAFTTTLLHELRTLPGVSAADVSFNLPLTGSGPLIPFQVRGEPLPHAAAEARSAGPQYFSAMGIPLLRGRMFSERDIAGAAPVVLISAEVARRWFRNEEPIGKVIETQWSGPGFPGERFGGVVIGVVGDVRQVALEQSKAPTIYMPDQQWPINEYDVVIRSTSASATTLAAARRVLEQLDADIPMNDARPFGDIVDAALGQRRMYLMLLGDFAAVALVLAAVGVYGVTAYGVEQRRREIGIRLALGATSQRVLRMVLSNGLRPVASGILLGLAAALALTRVLDDLLFQVTTRDPVTFVVVPIVLSAVAVLACIFPARRAARLDPMETIRAY